MTPFKNFLKEYGEKIMDTLVKKGEDYAKDPLSNFQYASSLAKISTEQSILNQIGIKVARIHNLVDQKDPNFESIQDSRLDLIGYLILWEYHFQELAKSPISEIR